MEEFREDFQKEEIMRQEKTEEKLKIIYPILENGFISNVLLNEEEFDWETYKTLFGIQEDYGYMIALEYGDKVKGWKLTNPIGAGVEIQRYQDKIRQILRRHFDGIIGGPLLNRMFICVPFLKERMSKTQQDQVRMRAMRLADEIERESKLQVKIGIGNIRMMKMIHLSCQQALAGLKQLNEKIVQIDAVCGPCKYEEDYPLEVEEEIFLAIKKGNVKEAEVQSRKFFDWMVTKEGILDDNIRLKCLEFVLRGETIGYFQGGMTYNFDCRQGYLQEILSCKNFEEMKEWFLPKMEEAAIHMGEVALADVCDDQSIVGAVQEYVKENYRQELTLNKMAEMMHVHPNYLSRIFKEKTGISYVDFVSRIKVEKAEKMLQKGEKSIKQVSIECGYINPNYFGRIFKKKTGMSPGEYRKKQMRTVYPDGADD